MVPCNFRLPALAVALLCTGAGAQPVEPTVPQLQPLPRVKITATLTPHFPSSMSESHHPAKAASVPEPNLRLLQNKLEIWLFERSFISRVSGHRFRIRRIARPRTMWNIALGDTFDLVGEEVPFSFVIAWHPRELTGTKDFSVRYYDELSTGVGRRISNMETLSWQSAGWYPHYLLQRAALSTAGLPDGTSFSRETENSVPTLNVFFPEKDSRRSYRTRERLACRFTPGQLSIEQYSQERFQDRTDPERLVQTIVYRSFDPAFPSIPRQMEITSRMMVEVSSTVEVSSIEEFPGDATFEELLEEVRQGLPRVYSHGFNPDKPLTSTQLLQFDGRPVMWDDYKDKVLLLHAWASWSPDNEKRFLELKRTWQKHGNDPGFAIVSINFDAERDDPLQVLQKAKPGWPQVYAGADPHVAELLPIEQLPAAFLLPKGVLGFTEARGMSKAQALFGGENSAGQAMVSYVAEELALEKRREKGGGVYAGMFTEAGQELLRNSSRAEAFLVLKRSFDSDENGPVPEDAEQLVGYPILYQWPDLPRAAIGKLAELLLSDRSYAPHYYRRESHTWEYPEECVGLRLENGRQRLGIVFDQHLEWLELEAMDGQGRTCHVPLMLLKPEAAEKLKHILEPHLPRDATTTAGVERRLQEWRNQHLRRQ